MPWPDLTLVPEGSMTAISWKSALGLSNQPVRFVLSGLDFVPSTTVEAGLRRFVLEVLDRLTESGIQTSLSDEWAAIVATEPAEADFNRAAARLGWDPYSISDTHTDDLIAIAEDLEPSVLDEFLDSVDPQRIREAVQWLHAARERAQGSAELGSVHDLRPADDLFAGAAQVPPHESGYALARHVRAQIGLDPTATIDMNSLVSRSTLGVDPGGIEGYVRVREGDSVSLVLPDLDLGRAGVRSSEARALGLALAGSRHEYLLDPARTDTMKSARAFAAELLAPAEGIKSYLEPLAAATDGAFDAIARRFETSSILVRRQYQNQISGEQVSF